MSQARTVWYVEDDGDIARFVTEYLEEQGFAVKLLSDGLQVRNALQSARPDILLIDWNLPDDTGVSICRWVRGRDEELPLMIVTVKDDPADIVAGLQSGADDYVTKPFNLEVLRSRIEALLRRATPDKTTITCGNVRLNMDTGIATCSGTPLDLTPLELRLFTLFMKNKGRIVSRAVIHDAIWESSGEYVSDNALTVAIKRLRAKLGSELDLKTVRSFGYRLEDPR